MNTITNFVVGKHERSSLPQSRPIAPFMICLILIGLLCSVYVATIAGSMTGLISSPTNFYSGADIVGLISTLILFTITMICFYLTAVTDPGSVPREFPWAPEVQDPHGGHLHSHNHKFSSPHHNNNSSDGTTDNNSDEERSSLIVSSLRGFERKSDGRTRVCKTCNIYKPDRTHHCRRLGRCVLEMDHWCVWVRNTIGHRNKKYFLLMLTYGFATLISYCITLGPFLPSAIRITNALDFFIILCYILASLELVLLAIFWGFHVYMASNGFTTIEFREKRMASEEKLTKAGQKIKELFQRSPYDHGIIRNLKSILGDHIGLWLIPTRYGMPDGPRAGCIFEVRADHPLVTGHLYESTIPVNSTSPLSATPNNNNNNLNKGSPPMIMSKRKNNNLINKPEEPDQAAGGVGGGGGSGGKLVNT
jgi:hypothetical protein